MKVFKAESEIKNKVVANKTLAFSSPIKIGEEKPEMLIKSLETIRANKAVNKVIAKLIDEGHPDLMYGSAVLASTVMNDNDDVFLPEETWAARLTPINTPYNNEHEEQDIIGHIIDSRVLQDGKVVADDSGTPEYFDIEVDFVIYKSIFPAIAKDIYDNAPKGKKFVSMEARFDDFAYALVDGQNKTNVVERNEETAFLTKHLRAYGGTGKYKEYKIGRVLKAYRFIGMGNVDTPANERSKYTKLSYDLIENEEVLASLNNKRFYITKGNKMATIETLDQAKAVIEDLNKQVELLKTADQSKAMEALKAEKVKLEGDITTANAKIEHSTTEFTKVTEEVKTLKADLDKAKADLQVKVGELEKINKSAEDTERLTQLKEVDFEVTDANKAEVLSLPKEAFNSLVSFAKTYKDKKDKADNKDDKKDKSMKDKQKDGKSKAEEVLDNAQSVEDKDAVLETKGDDVVEETDINALAKKVMATIRKPLKKTSYVVSK